MKKPQTGDRYYGIEVFAGETYVRTHIWNGDSIDEGAFRTGNCFPYSTDGKAAASAVLKNVKLQLKQLKKSR